MSTVGNQITVGLAFLLTVKDIVRLAVSAVVLAEHQRYTAAETPSQRDVTEDATLAYS
jgi:hypothetical protein